MDNSLKSFLMQLDHLSDNLGEQECNRILDMYMADIEKEIKSRNGSAQAYIDNLKKTVLPIATQSSFIKHSYTKPKGYAGDYITQEMIWLGRTRGGYYRYNGSSRIGRCINSLLLDMANPKANEERVYILQNIILDSGSRIASIGCGSCIEFWDMGSRPNKEINLFLLDHDIDALHSAVKQLGCKENLKITIKQANILKYIIGPRTELGKRDLIYMFGLLDYFPVKSAKKIVKKLWYNVSSGGKLVFTNAHPDNPTRLWMELFAEWYLNYKDEAMMKEIITDLESIRESSLFIDKYDVYQYMIVQKD